MADESRDPWREELDAEIEKVRVALVQPILATAASWKESSTIWPRSPTASNDARQPSPAHSVRAIVAGASRARSTTEALAVAEPGAVLAAAEERLKGVVRFAREHYKAFYVRAQEGNRDFQSQHEGRLRQELTSALGPLREPLTFYYGIQGELRAHVEEQGSFGKLAGNFIRGYLGDPTVLVEGLMEIFGEGPAARKATELLERDKHASEALSQAIELACQRVDATVVTWWNHTVLPENQAKMQEEAEGAGAGTGAGGGVAAGAGSGVAGQAGAQDDRLTLVPAMIVLVLALLMLIRRSTCGSRCTTTTTTGSSGSRSAYRAPVRAGGPSTRSD